MTASHLFSAVLLLASFSHSVRAADSGENAFFEAKIRPVLVEHCYKCHSAQTRSPKGGLRVDTRDALRKGGDSGPAIVPGKPESSLLLKAMLHSDANLRMPPKGKLAAAVLSDFDTWIRKGAADPRTVATTVQAVDPSAAGKHWAFQPIPSPAIPTVRDTAWAKTPIDRFILAQLEAKGLTPSPIADRRTLLRRVYFDLLGLPSSPEAVDAFLADRSADAYERLIDQLLASPAYGERWGRHWLDVARYADTKDGVLMYGDDRVRPYAYTYRDYVISAFNADLPFDRFVHEQLAADRLEPRSSPESQAAMGWLTLGRMFDNNIHDIIDDRIDTVTRGLMGLTVSCARCHDHKYDPIPTRDYYSLYGVFANCDTPIELPLLRETLQPGETAFEKQVEAKRRELTQFLDRQYTLLLDTARKRVGDYLLHAATTTPDPLETAIFFLSLAPTDLRPQIIACWRRLLAERSKSDDPVFGPWHDLLALPRKEGEGFAPSEIEKVRLLWMNQPSGTESGQLNPLVRSALIGAPLAGPADLARLYGKLLNDVYAASVNMPKESTAAQRQLLALIGSDSPGHFPRSRTREYMSRSEKDAFGGKIQEIDRLAVRSAQAPPRAMVLRDVETITEPHVFIRGEPGRPGERVTRQFLSVIRSSGKPFSQGSGRLELAQAITANDNPLTARVLANRLWMHHFREPLVDSPSDFGLRTVAPTQLALLDYLANELRHGGWSIKKLHRRILLSSVYQQASFDREEGRRLDPENRLLWRMNRRRLDLEAMRDSLLEIAGNLDRQMHGRPVDITEARTRRRTVYGLVDRQSLPGVFRAFDFASPDQSTERRPSTTVPQQALFGMNAPFVLEQARVLAARLLAESNGRRIEALYRVVLGRMPTGEERELATAFLASREKEKTQGGWEQLAQVLLLTNELLFVD